MKKLSNQFCTLLIFLIGVSMTSCRDETTAPSDLPSHTPEMLGFSYTSFSADGFQRGNQRNALGELQQQTGSQWVSLNVFEFQGSPTSYDIGPNTSGVNPLDGSPWSTSATIDDIRAGAAEAHRLGLKLMLKPHLDLYSREWRATIQPDDCGQWFQSYRQFIMKYTRLATELNAELLCIGTELIVATQPQYTTEWRTIVDSIRSVYGGKLTYAANWSGITELNIPEPEYTQIGFWDALDYLGIDAYFPITASPETPIPSLPFAVAILENPGRQLASLSSSHRKPIIITEVGIQSAREALDAPWDPNIGRSPAAVIDTAAQELYYRAVIEAFGKQEWCAGMFWWNWESVPSANESTNYTPRNKSAAQALRAWYTMGDYSAAG